MRKIILDVLVEMTVLVDEAADISGIIEGLEISDPSCELDIKDVQFGEPSIRY